MYVFYIDKAQQIRPTRTQDPWNTWNSKLKSFPFLGLPGNIVLTF